MKFKFKPFFVAIGTIIAAIAALFFKDLFSKRPEGNAHTPTKVDLEKVSKESYVHPDISKEEEATDYQTQKIDSVIKDGAEKVETAKKDTNIKSTQKILDDVWDKM